MFEIDQLTMGNTISIMDFLHLENSNPTLVGKMGQIAL